MTTESLSQTLARARSEFNELIEDIRPALHRYCARMVGSVVDAEDIVQDALAKAYYVLPITTVTNLQGWLFRIAHNEAIDYLRRSQRQATDRLDDYPSLEEATSLANPLEEQEAATMALSLFVKLAPLQRSCVILKDVLGYSLAEISELLDTSVSAIKAALHRGRSRLRELAGDTEDTAPTSMANAEEAKLLANYVERFNARDFDALRAMLAEDVRLDLIGWAKGRGTRQVGNYYHRYSQMFNWRFAQGLVEGRPAILVFDKDHPSSQAVFFILIEWVDGRVGLIRDYHHMRYVIRDADVVVLQDAPF